MKTFADDTNRSGAGNKHLRNTLLETLAPESSLLLKGTTSGKAVAPGEASTYTRVLPYATLFAMVCAVFLVDAILPLRNLWLPEALLTQLGSWPVAPSFLLFPGWPVTPPTHQFNIPTPRTLLPGWGTLAMLVAAFALVLLIYLYALRRLPALISRRFLLNSTLILGLFFLLIPVVTSMDIFSYIAYARIWVVHGMNPLTTFPSAIHTDVIYGYVSWKYQPSAYGPTWALIASAFQAFLALCGLGKFVLPMILMLRLWGLAMHLWSVGLIWSIGGSLQRLHGIVSARRRALATLAFAWNPLLLLEACTNAHNDTTLLFIILLAIWFLVRVQLRNTVPGLLGRLSARFSPTLRFRLLYLAPALLLAVGTCLKINLVMLVPGFFFYQWLQDPGRPLTQRLKRMGASVGAYLGMILALYAPFWQGGKILMVLQVNPGTSRSINTLPYTLAHLYNSGIAMLGFPLPLPPPFVSSAEHFLHTLSIGLFVLLYLGLCWQAWRTRGSMRSIYGLVRWLAVTWLFYCSVGSPWFWPWYMVTFFGLYALLETSKPAQVYIEERLPLATGAPASLTRLFKRFQDLLLQPGVIRLLPLSLLLIYGFTTWAPAHSSIPGLPGFYWSYLTGALAWLLPLCGLRITRKAEVQTPLVLRSTQTAQR